MVSKVKINCIKVSVKAGILDNAVDIALHAVSEQKASGTKVAKVESAHNLFMDCGGSAQQWVSAFNAYRVKHGFICGGFLFGKITL